MPSSGIITNIQRCSTEDGPGIRTTVFMKGCPLHCRWCHNIETIDSNPRLVWHGTKCIGDQACVESCPENALELKPTGMCIDREACSICGICEENCPSGALEVIGKVRVSDELVTELLRDKVFFETSGGGVTLSGGEPLQQPDFVMDIARSLRESGVHVALDTTAYTSESTWRSILEYVDLVLLDIKHMDSQKHQEFTGVPLDRILANAMVLADKKIPTWVRTPIIPGHTDSLENITTIARFIRSNLPNVTRYDLLAFNKMCIEKYHLFGLEYPLKNHGLIEKEWLEELVTIARNEGVPNVSWSGMTKLGTSDENSQSIPEVKTCE